jgi:dTDP-4-dehydrorhamnose reductase
MKVIIFGSTGMLGNYMKTYFAKFFDVICIDRKEFDIETCNWKKLDEMLSVYSSEDIMINCAGAIPQQKCSIRKFIVLNTLFPQKANEISKKYKIQFIHITTDCVFSGKDGDYKESSLHDAEDIYGVTKSLGECDSCCTIRTSIIGEELRNKNSLLEWVKTHKSRYINGYENVFWNGITCLQLSVIIKHVITTNSYWKGVRHILSPSAVSKYELCQYINEVYELEMDVQKTNVFSKIMTLSTNFTTDYDIPDLKEQIRLQRSFFMI